MPSEFKPFNDALNNDLSYRLSYTRRMAMKEAHYEEVRKWLWSQTFFGKSAALFSEVVSRRVRK